MERKIKYTNNKNILLILLIIGIYIFLGIYCINNYYFWDTVQQVSKEAHWFYFNNFESLIIPQSTSEFGIMSTGYHPPLMGIITAFLWKIFGYHLWVSHAFIILWAIVLFYNLFRLLLHFFNEKFIGFVFLLVLIDVTLLSQFSIASPDFIMLTAFIISIRAILENKNILLAIGIVFLCCINMRGVFTVVILFISNLFYEYLCNKKLNIRNIIKLSFPYIPSMVLLAAYYIYYLSMRGWFFSDSAYSSHYIIPDSFSYILKHFITFGLRLVENGKIILWILFGYLFIKVVKSKSHIGDKEKFLLGNIILLYALYFIFIFISKMPFSPRYFLPQFLLLTVITLNWIIKYFEVRSVGIIYCLIFLFQITGHFWIYNDKISQSWDCKLTHLPYYELRKQCFEYIDANGINYEDISGGFCFSGNRLYTELENDGKFVTNGLKKKYFVYSNISNNEDWILDELSQNEKWHEEIRFSKWPVKVIIYKNTDLN